MESGYFPNYGVIVYAVTYALWKEEDQLDFGNSLDYGFDKIDAMPVGLKHSMRRNFIGGTSEATAMSTDSESPRQHSTPLKKIISRSRTPPSSPRNNEEGQKESAKLDDGQPGSASPTLNESPPSAVAPPSPPSVVQQQPKPKSVKHRKSRSPSPLPVVHPPPLQTIRLDIKLGGPDKYEVDITTLALDAGQRAPTPPPIAKPDSSDSEEDSDHPPSKTPPTQEKKGKKRIRNADYDLTDPFIDNSDLGIDDRTHFPQTKQKGFYVSSGEVALLVPEKSPRKPRSNKPLVLTSAATANIQALSQTISRPRTPTKTSEGTAHSPPPVSPADDEESKSLFLKRNRSASPPTTAADDSEIGRKHNKKARPSTSTDVSESPNRAHKNASGHMFSDELEASFDAIKVAIAEENWKVKGKFPPAMKPKLQQLALQAIVLGEYNDRFFSRMPLIFPYNKFTMTKLIKRLVYNDHNNLLITRREELLAELKGLADAGFEQAKSEWEKNVQNWKERTAKDKDSAAVAEGANQPDDAVDDHDDQDKETKEGTGNNSWSGKDAKEKEPPKKYRLTERMKLIFWELYCLSNECSRLTNEKNQLEGIPDVVSEQGMRKGLYQRIITAFPEGWMTSGNISRDVSVIKKKHETD